MFNIEYATDTYSVFNFNADQVYDQFATYGSDYKVTLDSFEKTPFSDDILESFQRSYAKYGTIKCYDIVINVTVSGSLKTETKNYHNRICKLKDTWYLMD